MHTVDTRYVSIYRKLLSTRTFDDKRCSDSKNDTYRHHRDCLGWSYKVSI